ncbi:uncharacterized protein METZ01_LOCUS230042 [marine metagenome]|uniref:Uncharacterized protein n=1 Tax=marine metagenome TaxID=408172 RepID=A0A382GQ12_9ZZZZ
MSLLEFGEAHDIWSVTAPVLSAPSPQHMV